MTCGPDDRRARLDSASACDGRGVGGSLLGSATIVSASIAHEVARDEQGERAACPPGGAKPIENRVQDVVDEGLAARHSKQPARRAKPGPVNGQASQTSAPRPVGRCRRSRTIPKRSVLVLGGLTAGMAQHRGPSPPTASEPEGGCGGAEGDPTAGGPPPVAQAAPGPRRSRGSAAPPPRPPCRIASGGRAERFESQLNRGGEANRKPHPGCYRRRTCGALHDTGDATTEAKPRGRDGALSLFAAGVPGARRSRSVDVLRRRHPITHSHPPTILRPPLIRVLRAIRGRPPSRQAGLARIGGFW